MIDWEAYAYEFDFDDVWNDSYLKEYLDRLYGEIFSEEEADAIVKKTEGKEAYCRSGV